MNGPAPIEQHGAAGWNRCTRSSPCPICGRHKYCSITPDGSAVVCTRVNSRYPTRNGAWLHPLTDRPRDVRRPLPVLPLQRPDLAEIVEAHRARATPSRITALAEHLGVDAGALRRLGAGWSGLACAFPMKDGQGDVVGIRYRNHRGDKWSETGGREGVFVPEPAGDGAGPLLFPEGPTDCAAALSLGFDAVGRPSCSGGVKHCAALARGRDVVVVADTDEPGQRGAEALASTLLAVARCIRIFTPPAKDLRAWFNAGATRHDVDDAIMAAPVQRLRVRYGQ